MMKLRFSARLYIKKSFVNLINKLTNFQPMLLSSKYMNFLYPKISNKIKFLKLSLVKFGIVVSLTAYWSVILVGTFLAFN